MNIKLFSRLSYTLGIMSLLVGIFLSITNYPTSAASPVEVSSSGLIAVSQANTCTPPGDWNQTVRLITPQNPTKNWDFNIDQPEADVILEFFYYQDYDRSGCPFDCSTSECQADETGVGTSPLGSITVTDGLLEARGGKEKLEGRLEQGSYQASFQATGRGASINVGLRIQIEPVPTNTPRPTETELPTVTDVPTDSPIPPTGTDVPSSPTPPSTDEPPTSTPTAPVLPPTSTSTPDNPPLPPSPSETPTATPDNPGLTATPTDRPPVPGHTLTPTTQPPISTQAPVLIPVTGTDLISGKPQSDPYQHLFINLGIGFLGLGLILHGISNKLR